MSVQGSAARAQGRRRSESAASSPSRERPCSFRVTTERHGGMAWLSLFGELDVRAAGSLARELLRVEGRVARVVLDARGLSFLDAVGLHILLHASQRAKRGGWDLAVIRGRRANDGIFGLPNVARRLRLVDDPVDLLT